MSSRLLSRRKSNIKPTPSIKEPKKETQVEFRWSTTVAQCGLTENKLPMNVNLINIDTSQKKALLTSSTSTARNLTTNRSSFPKEKLSSCSPRLPNINHTNKEKELSTLANENTNGHRNPLSLTYSQLHQAQKLSQTKKKSQTGYSIYPLSNDKRSNISVINTDISIPSESTSSSTNDKYIRLPTSQLKRLHVSNKYIKEAKKLYFNPASKVFVPRHSILQEVS